MPTAIFSFVVTDGLTALYGIICKAMFTKGLCHLLNCAFTLQCYVECVLLNCAFSVRCNGPLGALHALQPLDCSMRVVGCLFDVDGRASTDDIDMSRKTKNKTNKTVYVF